MNRRLLSALALTTVFAFGGRAPAQDGDPGKPKDSAEDIARFLAEESDESREPFSYRRVAWKARKRRIDSGGTPPADGKPVAQKSKALDVQKTADAFAEQRSVFDDFLSTVVQDAVDQDQHGEAVRRAIETPPWSEKLIAATIAVQDANGDLSPKAIKALIRDGVVSAEHAMLMWAARDVLVKRTLDQVQAKLHADYPDHTFKITILDSGSVGSIGSDIDKTLHVQVFGKDGQPVEPFGSGGLLGDYAGFLDGVVKVFDGIGEGFGAKNSIAKSLDTEFFGSSSLPKRWGSGTTLTAGQSRLDAAVSKLRAQFAVLQQNPGPAYQFVGKIIAQVTGRAVEQDVNLAEHSRKLREQRLSEGGSRGLVLEEMLDAMHSPAVVVTHENGKTSFEQTGVVDFLEQNGLFSEYDRVMAVENAVGDYEKLVHKVHACIDMDGSFSITKYDAYLNDIAKYGGRATLDTATFEFGDHDAGKPAEFGDFDRRFVPADEDKRFARPHDDGTMKAKTTPNGRPYTWDVHRELYTEALTRKHAGKPDADAAIQRDLRLHWAAQRASENALALKADPGLLEHWRGESGGYPYARVLEDVIDALKDLDPAFAELPPDQQLTEAKRQHLLLEESGSLLLTADKLRKATDRWMTNPREAYDEVVRKNQDKIDDLERRDRALEERKSGAADDAERTAIDAEQASVRTRLDEARRRQAELTHDPIAIAQEMRMQGLDTLRRTFFLFGDGRDTNFEKMLADVDPKYSDDLRIMLGVWKAQATEAEQKRLAKSTGVDLSKLPAYTRSVARDLATGYLEAYGVDAAALFRSMPGGFENKPTRVLGRFLQNTYVDVGSVAAPGNIVRAMQQAELLPPEARAQALQDAVMAEVIGPIPGVGGLYATYTGYRSGDPKAMAGGGIQLTQEMFQMWLMRAGQRLDDAALLAGGAGRTAVLNRLAGLGGTAAFALDLAKTSVEIVGHEAFAPVRDANYQIAYQGYVNKQDRGLLRAGTLRKIDNLVVQPITGYEHPSRFRFLFLRKPVAARFLQTLQAEGRDDAAEGLLWLGNADRDIGDPQSDDEDVQTFDAAVDTEIRLDVMIDLAADYGAIAAEAREFEIHRPEWSPDLVKQARFARDAAVRHLRLLAALQRAVRDRIAEDHARRARHDDGLDLWLLAARENLAAALHERFAQQVQLLYRAAVLDPGAEEQLTAEAEAHWQRFRALAPSFQSDAEVRREFETFSRPDKVWKQRLAAIEQEVADNGASSWRSPQEAVGRWLDGKLAEWDVVTAREAEDRARKQRLSNAQRMAAAVAAFETNTYMDARTPMDPFRLEQATAWYGQQIHALHMKLGELARAPIDDPDARVKEMSEIRARLNRLQLEHGLVMQGFAEAEAAVAPKIALELIEAWVAGNAPYGEPANAALKFIWHDKQTLDRVRGRLTTDLSRGRRLLPLYRAQSRTHRMLFPTRMAEVTKNVARLREHALKEAAHEARRLAEIRSMARERVRTMEGPLTLEIDPYLVRRKGAIEVHLDAKVRHEVTRAVDAEVKWDSEIVPYDKCAAILGADRWAAALEASETDEDDVLFAVRVRAAVTDVKAAKGFENRLYPKPWPSETQILIVPGRRTEEQPEAEELPPPGPLTVLPLRHDAPERFDRAEAIDWCEEEPRALYPSDRVAIFYRRPGADDPSQSASFGWRLLYPDRQPTGRRGMEVGIPLQAGGEADWKPAKEGSPGDFVAVVDLLTGRAAKGEAVAGAYVFQTAPARIEDAGLLGTGGMMANPDKDKYRDEGTFEVADHRLHFQGFIREPFPSRALPPTKHLTESDVRVRQSGSGNRVTWSIASSWTKQTPINGGPKLDTLTGRADLSVSLTFPEELNPHVWDWPKVATSVQQAPDYESLKRTSKSPYHSQHIIHGRVRYGRITATAELPPARSLVQGESPAATWGPSTQNSDGPIPLGTLARGYGKGYTSFTIRSDRIRRTQMRAPFGQPARPSWAHLSDRDAVFVIPVVLEIVDANSWQQKVLRPLAQNFGYAVYGARDGPYQGPQPNETDGATGESTDDPDGGRGPTAAGGGSGNGSGRNGASGSGSGVGRTGSGGSAAAGGSRTGSGSGRTSRVPDDSRSGGRGRVTEATVDPRNPDHAAVIREWLRVAEPPQNADPDVRLRYTPYGILEGKAKGGTITVNRKPDDVGLRSSEQYVWDRRTELDSLNHCTVGEYVVMRLNGRSTSGCAGRYPPDSRPTHTVVPRVTGTDVNRARSTLERAGLTVRVQETEVANDRSIPPGQVVAQRPPAGSQSRLRGRVTLVVAKPRATADGGRTGSGSGTSSGSGAASRPVVQPRHTAVPTPKEIRFPDLAGMQPTQRVVRATAQKTPSQGRGPKVGGRQPRSVNVASTTYAPKGGVMQAVVTVIWVQPAQLDAATRRAYEQQGTEWPGGTRVTMGGGSAITRYHDDRWVIVMVSAFGGGASNPQVKRMADAADGLLDQPAFAAWRFPPKSGESSSASDSGSGGTSSTGGDGQPDHSTIPTPKVIRFPDLGGLVPRKREVEARSPAAPMDGPAPPRKKGDRSEVNTASTTYSRGGRVLARVAITWCQPALLRPDTRRRFEANPDQWPGPKRVDLPGGRGVTRYHRDRWITLTVSVSSNQLTAKDVQRMLDDADGLIEQPAFAAWRFPAKKAATPDPEPAPSKERPKSVRFPERIGELRVKERDVDLAVFGEKGRWGCGAQYLDSAGKQRGALGLVWVESNVDWKKLRKEWEQTRGNGDARWAVRPGSQPTVECDEDGDIGVLIVDREKALILFWWGGESLPRPDQGAARRRKDQLEAVKKALFDQVRHLAAKPPPGTFD